MSEESPDHMEDVMSSIREILAEDVEDLMNPAAGVSTTARLGQPVWYVERRGSSGGPVQHSIMRTFVNALRRDGKIGVVHQGEGELYFDRCEAMAAWRASVDRQAKLYDSWAEELRSTDTSEEAADALIAASAARGATDNSWASIFFHSRDEDAVATFPSDGVPEPRFHPGQAVWGVCTERTHDIYGQSPASGFSVVEATVKEVWVNNRATAPMVGYHYDSAYHLDDELVFGSRAEAENARAALIRERIAGLQAMLTELPVVLTRSEADSEREMIAAIGRRFDETPD